MTNIVNLFPADRDRDDKICDAIADISDRMLLTFDLWPDGKSIETLVILEHVATATLLTALRREYRRGAESFHSHADVACAVMDILDEMLPEIARNVADELSEELGLPGSPR